MTPPSLDTNSSAETPSAGPQLRVLHLCAGNLFGGVERFLVTLARLSKTEMQSDFAVCFNGRLSGELREAGIEPKMLLPVRFSRPWTIWAARRALVRLLSTKKWNVAVTHSPWIHAIFAKTLRAAGVPLVFFAHGRPGKRDWQSWLASRCPANHVIANSQWTAEGMRGIFPGVSVDVGPYPVERATIEPSARARIRAELACPPNRVVIISSCRLDAWKGHRLLLSALARLKSRESWECWILGGMQRPSDFAFLSELKTSAAENGIDKNVRFLGEQADVAALLSAADIHCQLNVEPEPFGIAFIEALYAGLPVVTTRMGAPKELFAQCESVTLIEPGDASAASKVLEKLIQSPELRCKTRDVSPQHAKSLCDPTMQMAFIAKALSKVAVPITATHAGRDGSLKFQAVPG